MELTLTNRRKVILENTQTKTIENGMEIQYYGPNLAFIDNPPIGIIKYDDEKGVYFIEWEDIDDKTYLDNVDAIDILKDCGFSY